MSRRKKQSNKRLIITLIIIVLIAIYYNFETEIKAFIYKNFFPIPSYNIGEIPEYDGYDYVLINNNEPTFTEEEKKSDTFESYSKLDFLGRCGVAFANISSSLMPDDKREELTVLPSGWIQAKYDIVDGSYLYNRCHLIGYQLTGENDNEKNLITCTSHMNKEVMVDFENMVASYIKKTNNHVLYRVTPIFEGTNLVASGVQMEALSLEDNGKGVKFNVYIFNHEDGIKIDYNTGESVLA